jgi:hypothetical protein
VKDSSSDNPIVEKQPVKKKKSGGIRAARTTSATKPFPCNENNWTRGGKHLQCPGLQQLTRLTFEGSDITDLVTLVEPGVIQWTRGNGFAELRHVHGSATRVEVEGEWL